MDAEADGPQRHHLVIPERDNMRAALAWALESGERDFGLELVVSLENYWATALPEEGLEWATTFLDSGSERDSRVVARALRVQGGMRNLQLRPARRLREELDGGARHPAHVRGRPRRRHAPAPVLEHGDATR